MNKFNSSRDISKVHIHHTYLPEHSDFNGSNHIKLFNGIKNYHIQTNGWYDIGYHFIIFPDGQIMAGRDIDRVPASAAGFNTGAIAIACIGNFDKGHDHITASQLIALVYTIIMVLVSNGLKSDSIVYHHWMNAAKSCPGDNFLNFGNSPKAYENSLKQLVDNNINSKFINHGTNP